MRRLVRVEAVQVAHQRLHALVRRVLQQVPVDALIVPPLLPLGDLAAHEEQLLARSCPTGKRRAAADRRTSATRRRRILSQSGPFP